MMGWDEIFHPDLPKDIVVQSWRGPQSLAEGARQGYTGILSHGYYIDLMEPTSRHYLVDPLPASSGLSAEEAARIVGGEATMWSEWVTPPPTGWPEAALAQLDAAAKPRAALELAVVLPLRKLVVACAEVAQLSTMSRNAWKTRVDALAAPPPPQKR
jgi:hexosaminidase